MTKYDVPAEAFRPDRQPITDHLTIERRLSRLEDRVAILTDHNKSHGDRIAELEAVVHDLPESNAALVDNQAMHGAAIREIVTKLMAQGMWIDGPEPATEGEHE